MEYRTLTGTGASVSRASLGTMTFGKETDEATAIRMTHLAIDAGVNWIDTADAYSNGISEQITGKALQGKRHNVVLASKVANLVGPNPHRDQGLNRYHIMAGVENSLRNLGTDYLDIFYMHRPDYDTPIEESLAAFDLLVQQGKILYVGMSNYASWMLCEALLKAKANGWAPPVVTQIPYNLITRAIEDECLPFCIKFGMGITCYNPLAGGLLSGKHRGGDGPSKNTRFAESDQYYARYWSDGNFDAVARLNQIADQAGLTMVELAQRWLVSQPQVDSVLMGARTIAHLEGNIAAINGGPLDADTLAACDEVWAVIKGGGFRYNR